MCHLPNIVLTLEPITLGLRKIIASILCEATCIMVLLGCMSTTNSQGFVELGQILFLVAHPLLGQILFLVAHPLLG